MTTDQDKLVIGGHEFSSRFILGSGKYSLKLIEAAVRDAGAEIITLAVRRANTREQENILDYIPEGVTLLPNTSGARNAEEAVRIARLARELGCGDFVKIEIMRDSKYLLPDNQETIRATETLAREGFVVMPYMYPDLNAARDLANAGAAAVMPLAAPIGSNKGLATKDFIQILIDEIDLPIIVDAGIGRPSQACEAMEMGAAAIMANTALATAGDFDILITGDMERATEKKLIETYELPELDVLMAGHHGSKGSTSEELLEAVTPETVIISVGSNSYGHPAEDTLRRLARAGCDIYRTDRHGTVYLSFD